MSSRSSKQKNKFKERLFGGRSKTRCCFCHTSLTRVTATIEHVQPLSEGGGWDRDNLRLSCFTCNNERKNGDFEEFRTLKAGYRRLQLDEN